MVGRLFLVWKISGENSRNINSNIQNPFRATENLTENGLF